MSVDRARAARELQRELRPRAFSGSATLVRHMSLLHQLGETCPLLIVANIPGQPVVHTSPAFQALSGYSRQELAGRGWRQIFRDEPGRSDDMTALAGTLCAKHKNGAELWLNVTTIPQRNDCGFLTHHLVMFHDLTAEHRARETLEYRAHHDFLTGIANRHLLCDRFEQAAAFAHRHNSGFTLALIDLDGFKQINDGFGHDVGDAVLRRVADRLKEAVRGEDTVARLGGDEFCLLLSEDPDRDNIQNALDRITGSLMQPIQCGADRIPLSCSVGSSQYPKDGSSLELLLRAADLRLYSMKASARQPRPAS